MSYSIVQGDLAPAMALNIATNGAAYAVGGSSTVQLRWRKPDGSVSLVALTEINGALGQYQRVWVLGDTDQPGQHQGQIVVTGIDGSIRTWPSGAIAISWFVSPKLVP